MRIGLRRFAMREDQVARGAFGPNLEDIAPPGAAPSLVLLFEWDMFAVQELVNKERARFNILLLMLNAEGIVPGSQRQKKCRAATRERVEDAQPLCQLLAECPRENRHVEQHARKNL